MLDVETFEQLPADGLRLNDLARVRLRLAGPLLVDPYAVNRQTGAFVLVDEATNETVGAGMVAGGIRLTAARSAALRPEPEAWRSRTYVLSSGNGVPRGGRAGRP